MGSIAWTPLPLLMLLILFAAANSSVTVKRTSNDLPHPTTMELELILPDSNKKLLVPFSRITAFENIPMTVLDNGLSRSFSSNQVRHPSHSHYRDLDSGSVISVRHVNGNRVMSGHVMHDEILYSLEPIGEFNHRIVKSERSSADRSEKVMSKKLRNVVSRRRRQVNQSPTEYVVELHLLLDHTVWQTMNNIVGDEEGKTLSELYFYYSHILNGIDTVYRNIRAFSISVSCVGITIAKTPADTQWNNDLSTDYGINSVHAYARSRNLVADHIMAFTRKYPKRATTGKISLGRAYLDGICQFKKGSLTFDQGLHSWLIAAHELGHNLGATHDGLDDNHCMVKKNIMAASVQEYDQSDIALSYRFSSCSEDLMEKHIKYSGTAQCLTETIKPRLSQFTKADREGARLALEQVCKLAFPNISGRLTAKFYSEESQCAKISCFAENFKEYSENGMRAPVGTPCGRGKSCNWNGECSLDRTVPVDPVPVDPFPVYPYPADPCRGNRFDKNVWSGHCNVYKLMIKKNPQMCKSFLAQNPIKNVCCKTLADIKECWN